MDFNREQRIVFRLGNEKEKKNTFGDSGLRPGKERK